MTENQKPGVPYSEVAHLIQSFDLFLFRGGDFVSDAIAGVEQAYVGVSDFTHVGIAIRARDLDPSSDLWRPGDDTLYIFESTASGKMADGVPAVDGRGHLGAQLRDMARVTKHYDAGHKTRIAWMPLQDAFRDAIPLHAVDGIVERYMYREYNASCVGLAAAASPMIRHVRDCWLFRKIRSALCMYCCCGARPNTWLFCSEMVAQIYKDVGVFPDAVVPADVMPVDFLPEETTPLLTAAGSDAARIITVDADHQVPWVFRTLVRFHADPPARIDGTDDLIRRPEESPL
jgi:hypothetical protein